LPRKKIFIPFFSAEAPTTEVWRRVRVQAPSFFLRGKVGAAYPTPSKIGVFTAKTHFHTSNEARR
jgi:hypothetical protein